jgi:hypothetical protein
MGLAPSAALIFAVFSLRDRSFPSALSQGQFTR